jgi:predicted amidohydrolase
MARFVNIATIHFQVSELGNDPQQTALNQFRDAEARLDGTGVDLVVTCEGMESVGQTMAQAERVEQPGPMFNAYRSFAVRNRCTIAGSIKLSEAGKVYNALVFIGPDGTLLGDYRKVFPTAGELKSGISPGLGAQVVETPAGRLGGAICFDLNFDELRDSYRQLRPDVLCFSSMFHGGHLQRNWAFQCRCHFAAACKDNTSDILDPLGRILNSANFYGRIAWARVNLDRFFMHQDGNNVKFPDIRRKYGTRILVDAAPDLGTAILYSLDPELTASAVAQEFGLIGIDEYFAASRQAIGRAAN